MSHIHPSDFLRFFFLVQEKSFMRIKCMLYYTYDDIMTNEIYTCIYMYYICILYDKILRSVGLDGTMEVQFKL